MNFEVQGNTQAKVPEKKPVNVFVLAHVCPCLHEQCISMHWQRDIQHLQQA